MLNRILTLALMLSVVICCIFVFTEDPPELEQTGPLPILMYHDVTDAPTSDNPMVVTTEKLEGDLCWLKENGYHTILPQELTAGEPLPEKNRDHALTGDWVGHRECHIQPDWLLVYRVQNDVLVLTLTRTVTHSDLFGK